MLEEGDQLLAAVTAQGGTLTQQFLTQLDAATESRISAGMAIDIVDLLEVVQVDQGQHEGAPLLMQLTKAPIQEASIVDAGQGVPVCHVKRLLQVIRHLIQRLIQQRHLREHRQDAR
ncbi:hypothetical protein D3C72_1202110 [compost metagenome]